jgi:hypothetical protein
LKSFRSLVVLKRPPRAIWIALRDHMPELAERLPDIESLNQTERRVGEDGKINIVNEWRVRYPFPPAVRSIVDLGDIGWIDRNCWDERAGACDWAIEPFFLTEHIRCKGRTVFEPAMAGNGTRVTLEGQLELKAGFLRGFGTVLESQLAGILEPIVTTAIPKNLRGILEAAASFDGNISGQPTSAL